MSQLCIFLFVSFAIFGVFVAKNQIYIHSLLVKLLHMTGILKSETPFMCFPIYNSLYFFHPLIFTITIARDMLHT